MSVNLYTVASYEAFITELDSDAFLQFKLNTTGPDRHLSGNYNVICFEISVGSTVLQYETQIMFTSLQLSLYKIMYI